MPVQIQWRRDTAANWTSEDPILAEGEAGFETDTNLFKIGDGSTAWTGLDYAGTDTTAATHIADGSDAHDASAISILDAANDFAAANVEDALAELQSDNEAHVAAADPHTGYRLESATIGTADMTDIATGSVIGREAASTGDPQVLTMLPNDFGAGTSFPGSPDTNQRYFRTDLGYEFIYDGTRWVTLQTFRTPVATDTTIQPLSASTVNSPRGVLFTPSNFTNIWLVRWEAAFFVAGGGSALSGSHKWVAVITGENSGTTIATITIASGSSATYRDDEAAIGALLGTSDSALQTAATKTGTPGNLTIMPIIVWRGVAT